MTLTVVWSRFVLVMTTTNEFPAHPLYETLALAIPGFECFWDNVEPGTWHRSVATSVDDLEDEEPWAVVVDDDGCWTWEATDGGFGQCDTWREAFQAVEAWIAGEGERARLEHERRLARYMELDSEFEAMELEERRRSQPDDRQIPLF